MPRLESYDKKLSYSYCLGVFPSLTLLEARPDCVTRLLLHPDGRHNEGVAMLRERCAALGIREEEAGRILRREARKDNCYAGLVFDKYQACPDPSRPHVVLCQVSDGGNLGTALRASLGFGFMDVALIRPCVDPFDPRVLRGSMGAFYRMNLSVFDRFEDYRARFPGHALYPFMLGGATTLPEAAKDRPERFALVFGNEQSGLPSEFAGMGTPVFIPQSDAIDSLNLAMSVAVGCYAFRLTGDRDT